MTREELYQSIYTHDTIYIPPHEQGSAALEVALGCSWHKCTFCDFARDTFCIHPIEKIEQDIQILARLQPENSSLFLLGENVFCLSAGRLLQIFDLAAKYMPKVSCFAMYSRVDDILCKTEEELAHLKARGLRALHIGLESGSDSILQMVNKGITVMQIVEAMNRLDRAGILYYVTIIPGLGGRPYSRMHAIETARMLNRIHPQSIWCLKLKLWEDTLLYKEAQKGRFEEMTPLEILQEEYLMLQNLTVENCLFEDTTVLDQFTLVGVLPQQKAQLLDAAAYLIGKAKAEQDGSVN